MKQQEILSSKQRALVLKSAVLLGNFNTESASHENVRKQSER